MQLELSCADFLFGFEPKYFRRTCSELGLERLGWFDTAKRNGAAPVRIPAAPTCLLPRPDARRRGLWGDASSPSALFWFSQARGSEPGKRVSSPVSVPTPRWSPT